MNVLTQIGRGDTQALLLGAANVLTRVGDGDLSAVMLGAGSLVCYSSPLEDWTVFEIDPLVVNLATNPAVFSFVSQ